MTATQWRHLTPAERRIAAIVVARLGCGARRITQADICRHSGISTTNVCLHVNRLVDRGVILLDRRRRIVGVHVTGPASWW